MGTIPSRGTSPNVGLTPHQRLGRGRVLDGPTGLRSEAENSEAGVDCSGRSPAGAPRHLVNIVRIQCDPRHRTLGPGTVAGEVRQVRLSKNDSTGLTQPLYYHRIIAGNHVDAACGAAESGESRRSDQSPIVDVVLDDHRHAMQRPAWSFRSIFRVQSRSHRQGFGVHGDKGIVMFFIAGDPIQEGLRQQNSGVLSLSIVHLDLLRSKLDNVDLIERDRRLCFCTSSRSQQEQRQRDKEVPLQLPAHSASRWDRNLILVFVIDILKKNISHSKQQDQLMSMFKNLLNEIN